MVGNFFSCFFEKMSDDIMPIVVVILVVVLISINYCIHCNRISKKNTKRSKSRQKHRENVCDNDNDNWFIVIDYVQNNQNILIIEIMFVMIVSMMVNMHMVIHVYNAYYVKNHM